jgi:predicted nucleic acid-binding protein
VGIALHAQIAEATCHAPHLVDAEVGHVLRRVERVSEINAETAETALNALPVIIDQRYPHTGRLSQDAWELRHNITFYDGLYVALAVILQIPLLTADEKLSKAPDLPCTIELVA